MAKQLQGKAKKFKSWNVHLLLRLSLQSEAKNYLRQIKRKRLWCTKCT